MALSKKVRDLISTTPLIQTVGQFKVVREDVLPGGAKQRFLPYLVDGFDEVVFGGPFCGGAPYALSELGKITGQKVTLFYAKRAQLHERQIKAKKNGAKLKFVTPGYMTVVQAKARAYAQKHKALFLELGFDMPKAEEPFQQFLKEQVGSRIKPREIWCAVGSGMLARNLALAFPRTTIFGVAVGLKSRHSAQQFPENVVIVDSPYAFAKECRIDAPFPSCPNYDRKAWACMLENGKSGAVLYNVL